MGLLTEMISFIARSPTPGGGTTEMRATGRSADKGVIAMVRIRVWAAGRSIAAAIALAAAGALAAGSLTGIAEHASAATVSSSAHIPSRITNSSTRAEDFAYFNARRPLLRKYLAEGDSLQKSLSKAGYPALRITLVGRGPGGMLMHPDGASCQDFTCGWKFSALTTYEIEYLMWTGEIAGPAGICLLFGGETAGVACAIASGIYSVLSAYAFPTPRDTGKCLYAGVGAGQVVKLEKC